MELLPAMVALVGLYSDKGLATAEAAGHLQQHALLERPLGVFAADAVHGPGNSQAQKSATSRNDLVDSSGAPGKGGTAAAAEDVLLGEPSTGASQDLFRCLGIDS
jgi:hypothetical protein